MALAWPFDEAQAIVSDEFCKNSNILYISEREVLEEAMSESVKDGICYSRVA